MALFKMDIGRIGFNSASRETPLQARSRDLACGGIFDDDPACGGIFDDDPACGGTFDDDLAVDDIINFSKLASKPITRFAFREKFVLNDLMISEYESFPRG